MSIEGLKEQARRHEQREEWKQALDLYRRAIERLVKDEQPDISLYNRVGDLCVRVGDLDQAIEHYEQAVDLYMEAELANNAIAVCKKIIRNVPMRNSVYLKMGQIRGEQGFLTDARHNFLTYAERVQAEGDIDEALRALMEFADLSPNDVEVRLAVAQQLERNDRKDEAVDQLKSAHVTLMAQGETSRAESIEKKIREIDPTADLMALGAGAAGPGFETTSLADEGVGIGGDFGDIVIGAVASQEVEEEETTAGGDFAGFEISVGEEAVGQEEEEEAAEPLPMLGEEETEAPSFVLGEEEEPRFSLGGEEEKEEEEAEPLPAFGFEEEEEAEPLPTFGYEEETEPLPTFDEEPEPEPEPLPMLGEEEEEAEPLPFIHVEADESVFRGEAPPATDTALTAEAFGEADRGEKEAEEYVQPGEEMVELEVGLSGLELGVGEEVGTAREEAMEEAAFESRSAGPEAAPTDVEGLISAGDLDGAERLLRDLMAREPDEISHRQRLVEVAYRRNDSRAQADAYLELAGFLERAGNGLQARGVYQQVLNLDPENARARSALEERAPAAAAEPASTVASSDDYVDLGSLIFDEEEEKTTRFKVAYEEPSGDEAADFARMLTQFKAKVAENVGTDDVRAHHDLGTAYKEMGLLDEAIEEFQAALRASRDHLPTYELLGQCFLDKGQHEAAVKSLTRALNLPFEIEDELMGIYYYLGRAHEALGNRDSAVEFYDRVFSLDINFMDVTERLRALR